MMKKPAYLFLILYLVLQLTACQKPESSYPNENVVIQDKLILEKPFQNCRDLSNANKYFKQHFAPEALMSFNQQLKTCLKNLPLAQRYQWMEKAQNIYLNQIKLMSSQMQSYITETSSEGYSLSKDDLNTLFTQLDPHEQYLAKHQKALYFYQYNLGEGEFTLTQDPRYYFEIFATSLPKEDQIYLQQELKESTSISGSIDKDAGLSVSFTQLGDWITFWENYIQRYPKAHFSDQAHLNIQAYQKYLFLGLENTPVFEFDDNYVQIDPDALSAIEKLAKTPSASGLKAQKLLQYVQQFQTDNYANAAKSQEQYNARMIEIQGKYERFQDHYAEDLSKILDLR